MTNKFCYENHMEKTLLTAKDLLSHPEIPYLSLNTIKRHVADGHFPAPIHYGPRCVRWRQSDIRHGWSASAQLAA